MSKFFGDSAVTLLQGRSLKPVKDIDAVLGGRKYVLVYFSAHWCPPCRAFTPQLLRFYENHQVDKNFEIIFVSMDKSAAAMSAYMESAHGDWLAMSYESAMTVGKEWASTYAVPSIPTLLVFENTESGRKLVTRVGRDMVMHDEEAETFPWVDGEAHMKAYKRGLLRNIIICIIIAMIVGSFLFQYTF